MNYTLVITKQELDILAQALQDMPYRQVAPVIATINAQVIEQDNGQKK